MKISYKYTITKKAFLKQKNPLPAKKAGYLNGI